MKHNVISQRIYPLEDSVAIKKRSCYCKSRPDAIAYMGRQSIGELKQVARMAFPREEQRQQTRAKLVGAALRVFGEQGYDHATVEEISLEAGYSKGAYYFYFNSKEDILLELVADWIEEQTRRLMTFEKRNGPAGLRLIETLESFMRYDDRDLHWRLLLPEIWAQSYRNSKVKDALQAAYAKWNDLLQRAFETSDKEGFVSLAVRPNVAASLVLAAHDGLTLRSRLKSRGERELSVSQVVNALVALIAPSGSSVTLRIPPSIKRTARRKS